MIKGMGCSLKMRGRLEHEAQIRDVTTTLMSLKLDLNVSNF